MLPHVPDAHARPPQQLREIYKKFHKLDDFQFDGHPEIIDSSEFTSLNAAGIVAHKLSMLPVELEQIFATFLTTTDGLCPHDPTVNGQRGDTFTYEVTSIPGLFIYPSLFPSAVQLQLLQRLLFRDLSDPQHQTNVHLHYDVPYPAETKSYFDKSSGSPSFEPKDPGIHKPFTTAQYLNKKLRWMTLGGQYDWTRKIYPTGHPPPFPSDIGALVEGIFPMKAEAAIVNLYSPGDTLSLHRDVSEECAAPLVSVSLGCDGIFICGLEDDSEQPDPPSRAAVLRLRSGDAVLMSGEARYAWHGVPKVLGDTCPEWMQNWPENDNTTSTETESTFGEWRGWMKGKRVNLNVRQMFAA